MKIHTEALYPWSDVHRALSTMTRLTVKVGDVVHEGWFDLSQADDGAVTLAFEAKSGWEDKPVRSDDDDKPAKSKRK